MNTPRTAAARTAIALWAAVLVVIGGVAALTISTAADAAPAAVTAATEVAVAPAAEFAAVTLAAPATTEAPATTAAPAPSTTEAPAPTTAPVTTAAPATTAPVAASAANGIVETWAVVIGINTYNGHEMDLGAAVADAKGTVAALEAGLGVDAAHRLVLLDGAATNAAVLDAVAWLVHNAGPEDDAVFFYAGHVNHHGGSTQALLLPDGTEIFDVELRDALTGLEAARTWLPIAGCFAGGFDELLAPGRMLTAASSANELSYENDNLTYSYMVQYVIVDQLGAGQAASIEAAFAQGTENLRRDFPNRLPLQFDNVDGDWALAR